MRVRAWLSTVDFSVDIGKYMLPSNLNLSIGKTKRYSNKILVSSTDMKIGSNRDINKDRKKYQMCPENSGLSRDNNSAQPKRAYWKVKWWKTSLYSFDRGEWFDCLPFLIENEWHYYSQSLAESLVLYSVQWCLAVLTLHLACSRIMVQRNAKDII